MNGKSDSKKPFWLYIRSKCQSNQRKSFVFHQLTIFRDEKVNHLFNQLLYLLYLHKTTDLTVTADLSSQICQLINCILWCYEQPKIKYLWQSDCKSFIVSKMKLLLFLLDGNVKTFFTIIYQINIFQCHVFWIWHFKRIFLSLEFYDRKSTKVCLL